MANSTDTLAQDALRDLLRDSAKRIEAAEQQKKRAVANARAAGLKWHEICEIVGVTRPTAMRYAREAGEVTA